MDFGLCFHREESAASVVERARSAEAGGFDEFWVIEDCFFTAGVSLASTALAVTEAITVGLGIMPVVARNAAITAMEIATMAELAPGRFHAGMGHGVQDWMRQMDAAVASPLTMLEETFVAVQRLLAGETVSVDGRYVTLRNVQLDQPPSTKPLVSAGVRGPKSMAIAGRAADGVILADFVSADYVRWVRDIVGPEHRITVFSSLPMGPPDAHDDLRDAMAGFLAEVVSGRERVLPSIAMAPGFDEVEAKAETIGWFEAARSMPDSFWTGIAAFGSPDTAATYVQSLAAAGADAVTFFPNPFDPLAHGQYAARELLPLLRDA